MNTLLFDSVKKYKKSEKLIPDTKKAGIPAF